MLCRCYEHKFLITYRHRRKLCLSKGLRTEYNIISPSLQIIKKCYRRSCIKCKMYITATVFFKEFSCKPRHIFNSGRSDESKSYQPFAGSTSSCRLNPRIKCCKSILCTYKEFPAESCECRIASILFKQRHPKLIFKLCYRMAETRLRYAKILCCLRIMSDMCKLNKIFQVKKIH